MKNTWVLSIRTSLPEICESHGDLQTSIYTFDSFEEARSALRKVLKKYAFSENSMFNGNKLNAYREQCKNEALELFSKWFYRLGF